MFFLPNFSPGEIQHKQVGSKQLKIVVDIQFIMLQISVTELTELTRKRLTGRIAICGSACFVMDIESRFIHVCL